MHKKDFHAVFVQLDYWRNPTKTNLNKKRMGNVIKMIPIFVTRRRMTHVNPLFGVAHMWSCVRTLRPRPGRNTCGATQAVD